MRSLHTHARAVVAAKVNRGVGMATDRLSKPAATVEVDQERPDAQRQQLHDQRADVAFVKILVPPRGVALVVNQRHVEAAIGRRFATGQSR